MARRRWWRIAIGPLLTVLLVSLWGGSLIWNDTETTGCDQGGERVTTDAYSFTVPAGFRHMPEYDNTDFHYFPPFPPESRPPDEPDWVPPYARTELRMCLDPRTKDRVVVSVGVPPTRIEHGDVGAVTAWLEEGYGTNFSPIMVDGHVAYAGVFNNTVEVVHLFAGSFVVDVRCQRQGNATWPAVLEACRTVASTLRVNEDLEQSTSALVDNATE